MPSNIKARDTRRTATRVQPPRRPDPTTVFEDFERDLQRTIARLQESLTGWADKIATGIKDGGLLHELEWSAQMFTSAAELKVAMIVLEHFTTNETKTTVPRSVDRIRAIARHFTNEALNKSQWQRHSSTSATSNLAEECDRIAYVEKARSLREWLEYYDDLANAYALLDGLAP